jgi:hypothetical protein
MGRRWQPEQGAPGGAAAGPPREAKAGALPAQRRTRSLRGVGHTPGCGHKAAEASDRRRWPTLEQACRG